MSLIEDATVYVNRRRDKSGEPNITDEQGNMVVPYGIFEIIGGQLARYSVDGGQLSMRVKMVEKNGTTIADEPVVNLKQYGGDRLARSLLRLDLEAGDRFMIEEDELGNFQLEPVDSTESS